MRGSFAALRMTPWVAAGILGCAQDDGFGGGGFLVMGIRYRVSGGGVVEGKRFALSRECPHLRIEIWGTRFCGFFDLVGLLRFFASRPQNVPPASRIRVGEILTTLIALGQARVVGDRYSL